MQEGKVNSMEQIDVFAINLDRLMTLRGMRNSTLAQEVDVSREMIRQWRQGRSLPKPEREDAIARALRCKPWELFAVVDDETPAMLPIGMWATREGIPAGRAKALFELGILTGGTIGENGEVYLVPVGLRAPTDSKHLVRVARRPPWIAMFAVNFDAYMREKGISNYEMADCTNVGPCAVTNWRSGRSNPVQHRLPIIASKLRVTVDDLLKSPSRVNILEWKFRYNRKWPVAIDMESEAA